MLLPALISISIADNITDPPSTLLEYDMFFEYLARFIYEQVRLDFYDTLQDIFDDLSGVKFRDREFVLFFKVNKPFGFFYGIHVVPNIGNVGMIDLIKNILNFLLDGLIIDDSF